MKEISQRLGAESYALIDTTLRQFGQPTSNTWDGLAPGYVLRMIDDADDKALVDLARHVGYSFELMEAPVRIDPPFWKKGMFRLFLSHLAIQKKYASDLQTELLPYGISCFVAHSDIEPTSEWQTQIETALATCDGLVALLHEKFHESKWTDQEIGFAMGRGVPAFSVRLGETPYGFIGRFQAFNGNRKSVDALAAEIFESFRKNKQTQHKMAEVVVKIFEDSNSFRQAHRNMAYLEELEIWEPSFSERIQGAVQLNNQTEGAFGVPKRVEKLVQKWKGKV